VELASVIIATRQVRSITDVAVQVVTTLRLKPPDQRCGHYCQDNERGDDRKR